MHPIVGTYQVVLMSTHNIMFLWKIKKIHPNLIILVVFGFSHMSTLVDHFVSPPREREKRDRRDSRR